MSEPIPESIPTSAHSHRPSKRRHLSPSTSTNPATASQAAHLATLFANPDRPIALPPSTSKPSHTSSLPPEIVANVQGSSAGAGSGEFHVYKASRRREYERLRRMDEEVKEEREDERWEREREEKRRRDEERTEKKRRKRRRGKDKDGKGGREDGEGKAEVRTAIGHEDIEGGDGVDGNGPVVVEDGVVIHDDD